MSTRHMHLLSVPIVLLTAVLLCGCPTTREYDAGYDEGFALDDWYWDGFYDSYDTEDDAPVYYAGGTIPSVLWPEYDRGYYDGIWAAYNDGYFVCYDYAFTVGFSEGYDAAYYPDYLDFLAGDTHVEYDNGGWGDGYNDGFSEGRIFGANDYEQALTFDWLDALLDYRSGTDLYFEEIDLGTGVYGPVYLYEYGTDPLAKQQSIRVPSAKALRDLGGKNALEGMTRPISSEVQTVLNCRPTTAGRGGYTLRLTTTWLDRIEAYLNAPSKAARTDRTRSTTAPQK